MDREASRMLELVSVYWPLDLYQAHAIREALQDEGVEAVVEGEYLSTTWFGSKATSRMSIMVARKDEASARDIIDGQDWPSYTPRGGAK